MASPSPRSGVVLGDRSSARRLARDGSFGEGNPEPWYLSCFWTAPMVLKLGRAIRAEGSRVLLSATCVRESVVLRNIHVSRPERRGRDGAVGAENNSVGHRGLHGPNRNRYRRRARTVMPTSSTPFETYFASAEPAGARPRVGTGRGRPTARRPRVKSSPCRSRSLAR
ncbi:MAG: hypothetical protein JWQ89_4134 [Devosia sp.]|nr:hypothetical protein [Devosia sp.]